MNTSSANVRNMLRTYGKQLTSAKRLARFRQAMGEAKPPDDIARQAKRRELVQRIAHEVIENLIVNSERSPVVRAVLDQLESEFGGRYVFEYPLDGSDIQIIRETPQGPQEIENSERNKVMRRLWEIALSKVDGTML
ncbi:DVU0524 family FlgM-associated protein [Desulfovibrio sp. Huiquan2017]|uniref:DVU0524 family FlgM-associated protein n=1 Tax=Desulfovibrio sp. Huiquan2017 TaxID=2816861 RepID=UPI001A92EBD4